ncbi:hypothetical protein BK816_07950 [Boudabousia tangfeifanii]|uniref:Histidine phosphatase family protein n=1 Tax=Boudabousia tangfeifanii TaxID=1912795 RepID=A0A1D9MLP6_9ACTO|nr:histidine phosphatase family protein [Boudabousia tangfeifanii]AOZ73227.1 hypothetical protein BK816_07950 [Boudabousia tangfeifanii]
MKLLLIRHAESQNNALMAAGRADERVPDPAISSLGQQQSQALANWLQAGGSAGEVPPPTRLVSSLMRRTIETALPTAKALNLPIEAHLRTFERRGPFAGTMSNPLPFYGTPRSELQAITELVQLPAECTEDGWWDGHLEDSTEGYERALELAAWLRAMPEDETVYLVAHGDIGTYLINALMNPGRVQKIIEEAKTQGETGEKWVERQVGNWVYLDNTSTSLFQLDGDETRIYWMDRIDHLNAAGLAGKGASALDTSSY